MISGQRACLGGAESMVQFLKPLFLTPVNFLAHEFRLSQTLWASGFYPHRPLAPLSRDQLPLAILTIFSI